MVSGSDSAAPLLGNVADGSMREDANPLSLPGPLTDSDSEPCGQKPGHEYWWEVEKYSSGWMKEVAKQLLTAKYEKP